jgi:hypothetical protein
MSKSVQLCTILNISKLTQLNTTWCKIGLLGQTYANAPAGTKKYCRLRAQLHMYVYSRGGPQTAPAPRPSLIYCAFTITYASGFILEDLINLKIKKNHVYFSFFNSEIFRNTKKKFYTILIQCNNFINFWKYLKFNNFTNSKFNSLNEKFTYTNVSDRRWIPSGLIRQVY